MDDYRILHGDALTMLRTLPDASVHCCVTSPPYYGLRDTVRRPGSVVIWRAIIDSRPFDQAQPGTGGKRVRWRKSKDGQSAGQRCVRFAVSANLRQVRSDPAG